MIIQRIGDNSNYPFTKNSTMLLNSTGLRLMPGAILSAKLYPRCGSVPYVRIAEIGRTSVQSTVGSIVIVNDSDNVVCRVSFDLQGNTVVGKAYDETGCCGVIVGTPLLLPILKSRYLPEADSFIFSPSSFFPRPSSPGRGVLRSKDGSEITSLTFDSTDFNTSATGEVSVKQGVRPVDIQKPVSAIRINGKTVGFGSKYVNIYPEPGSDLRVVASGSTIHMGDYYAV